MSFNSVTFIAFLGLVLALHRLLPWRAGRVVLVAASYLFYGFGNAWYCLLLLTSTVVDFTVARRLARSSDPFARKALLLVSICANLGLLAFFKYGDFAIENLNWGLGLLGGGSLDGFGWALPVGISFYTFQTMSYTIDVYQEKIEPTRDFVGFALYVAFFPQLLAGPIERAGTLLPQLSVKQHPSATDLERSFQRILWGLAKKVVVADRLGLYVDHVYAVPAEMSGPSVILATACFAFQIYLDFSGYCDIAIGVAGLLGVKLRENFNWPLLARNPGDFWARWHITLGTWFRDYLFTALVGRRRPGTFRKLFNLVLIFTLIGLWHGAGWNFVLFGLVAGLAVASYELISIFARRPRNRGLFGDRWWSAPVAIALTSLHSFGLALLFRSPNLEHAQQVAGRMLESPWTLEPLHYVYGALAGAVWIVCAVRGIWFADRRGLALPPPLRAAFWCALVLLIIYGAVNTTEQFIYFQF